MREVTGWTVQSEAECQDTLRDVAWDMSQDSSDNVDMFADVFIGKLVSDIGPKVTINDLSQSETMGGQNQCVMHWTNAALHTTLGFVTGSTLPCVAPYPMNRWRTTCSESPSILGLWVL